MNPDGARSELASCGTRLIRAELLRRFHRLGCALLHEHIMPMGPLFFKPLPFHQLLGLYHYRVCDMHL